METLRLVLLGPPASGKGTQGQLMNARWGVPVTSIGEMLRHEIVAGTPLGVRAAGFMSNSSLVPDDVALQVVENWMTGHGDSFVFDGFPRTVGQAEALDTFLASRGTPLQAVLWLELDRASIEARVRLRVICRRCGRTFQVGGQAPSAGGPCPVCGSPLSVRDDDDPATLAHRMEQYARHTEPLLKFYEERHLLRRINAGLEAEEVFVQIEATTHQAA